jgi:hypothetical protein
MIPRPSHGDSIRSCNMDEWVSLAQQNTLDLQAQIVAGPEG